LIQLLDLNIEVVFADQLNPLPGGHANYQHVWYPLFGKCIYRKIGYFLGDLLAKYTFIPLLRQIRRNYQPDITHVHWVDCHAYYCMLAELKPLVLSVWGSDINNCFLPGADLKHNQILGITLSKADKILVDSEDMNSKCSLLAGHQLKSTELLHLGLNLSHFGINQNQSKSLIKQNYQLPGDARILLSVRAFLPFYQHEKILLAFAEVLPLLTKKTVLVFKRYNEVNNKYYEHLLALAKQLGIDEKIYWIEKVPDKRLSDLFFISDAYINFPVQDTFPVTFLEAAVSEKPMITNILPSYEGTFVVNYFHLVNDESVSGLAKAIYDEFEVAPTTQEKLRAAHQAVENSYSENNYKNRLIEIYRDLLKSN